MELKWTEVGSKQERKRPCNDQKNCSMGKRILFLKISHFIVHLVNLRPNVFLQNNLVEIILEILSLLCFYHLPGLC